MKKHKGNVAVVKSKRKAEHPKPVAPSASAIFLKAAQRIASGVDKQMCWALCRVTDSYHAPISDPFCRELASWFSPTGRVEGFGAEITDHYPDYLWDQDQSKDLSSWRCLMLLLMSEIANDQERRGAKS